MFDVKGIKSADDLRELIQKAEQQSIDMSKKIMDETSVILKRNVHLFAVHGDLPVAAAGVNAALACIKVACMFIDGLQSSDSKMGADTLKTVQDTAKGLIDQIGADND